MSAPLLLTWLAGTLLPLGTLWLVYRLALRGERCFGYNRAFLLLAPGLAAALPLLPRPAMPLWLSSPAVAVAAGKTGVAVLLPTVEVSQAASYGGEWPVWTWLGWLYLAGVALSLGRIAWQAGRLGAWARRLPREQQPGYVLARTGGRLPTSSFGRLVFWDETVALAPAEAAAVLAHEVAHVRQRHTLDVLWLEVWRAVLWPNPFAHLLLRALRLTHELLADRAAAAVSQNSAVAYPTLLARLAARQLASPAAFSLLQPFTFSFTLTRIAMLQHQIPVRRWKQWLVLPVLAALSFVAGHAASAQPVPANPQAVPKLTEAQQKERSTIISHKLRVAQREDSSRTGNKLEPGTKQQFHITNWKGPGEPIVTVTRVRLSEPADGTVGIEPDGANKYAQTPQPPKPQAVGVSNTALVKGIGPVYTFVEQMPQLPDGGGTAAIVQAIQRGFVYPAGGKIEGRVFATFIVAADGIVREAKIVKSVNPAYDAAVLAAIQQLPRFIPGKQNGQAAAVSLTVPIQFKVQ